MSNYTPNSWVILKIQPAGEPLYYKVLAGWSGGYLDGDSWRMNSGITEVKADSDGYFLFYGSSGSCYQCHKHAYRLTGATAGIYNQLKERFGDAVELMPEDTDWRHLV
jgi:hypothetical protein